MNYANFLTSHFAFLPLGFWFALLVLLFLGWLLVQVPLANAGAPDEPAPPSAVM